MTKNRPEDQSANPPTPAERGGATGSDAGLFYWQLPEDHLAALRDANLILEDEGYLAHDVNWGRQLLDVRPNPASVPDVLDSWVRPATVEHLSDAISAILQVAVEIGSDPQMVAERALETHRAVRWIAANAIRRS